MAWTWASAWVKLMFESPLAAASVRAISSSIAEMSTPSTRPGDTFPAISNEVSPHPQPMSRTLWPAANPALAMATRPIGAICRSSRSCSMAQERPTTSFQFSISAAFACEGVWAMGALQFRPESINQRPCPGESRVIIRPCATTNAF